MGVPTPGSEGGGDWGPGFLGLREDTLGVSTPGSEGGGAGGPDSWDPDGRRAERARPGFRGPGPRAEGGIPRPLLRRPAPPRPRPRPGPSGACAARSRRASARPCSRRAGGGGAAAPGAAEGAEEGAPGKSLGGSSCGIPASGSPCPRVGRDVGGAGGGGAWRRKLRQERNVSEERRVPPEGSPGSGPSARIFCESVFPTAWGGGALNSRTPGSEGGGIRGAGLLLLRGGAGGLDTKGPGSRDPGLRVGGGGSWGPTLLVPRAPLFTPHLPTRRLPDRAGSLSRYAQQETWTGPGLSRVGKTFQEAASGTQGFLSVGPQVPGCPDQPHPHPV